jgi:hypothetical protein
LGIKSKVMGIVMSIVLIVIALILLPVSLDAVHGAVTDRRTTAFPGCVVAATETDVVIPVPGLYRDLHHRDDRHRRGRRSCPSRLCGRNENTNDKRPRGGHAAGHHRHLRLRGQRRLQWCERYLGSGATLNRSRSDDRGSYQWSLGFETRGIAPKWCY